MRAGDIRQAIAIVCILGAAGCSRTPTTAPKPPAPPAVQQSVFEFDMRFTYADSGYTLNDAEYADSNGVVRKIDFHRPVWHQAQRLKPGDRMYLRAEVGFPSGLAGVVQIVGPAGFYRSDECARLDGPATSVLVIDEIVK